MLTATLFLLQLDTAWARHGLVDLEHELIILDEQRGRFREAPDTAAHVQICDDHQSLVEIDPRQLTRLDMAEKVFAPVLISGWILEYQHSLRRVLEFVNICRSSRYRSG
jgi:hypothetical protein